MSEKKRGGRPSWDIHVLKVAYYTWLWLDCSLRHHNVTEIPATELASALSVPFTTMTSALKKLREMGVVEVVKKRPVIVRYNPKKEEKEIRPPKTFNELLEMYQEKVGEMEI